MNRESVPAAHEIYDTPQGGAYRVDFAGGIDSPAEVLAEELGVSRLAAERVLAWHEREIDGELRRRVIVLLSRVVAELIQPQKNLAVVIWGLAFSCGLAAARNGASSMALEADRLGLHRASLSYWKRRWDGLLGQYGGVYGKSAETCARNRAARLRVLADQHGAGEG